VEGLIGVEFHDGQAERVVLHHAGIDAIREGKSNRRGQILTTDLLITTIA
jgi:hypothetical protein